MPTLDPRIDAYLATVPAFARPILQRLREDVHAACPGVVETLKWSRPHFMLDDKLLCGMSAFKAHCAFGFWEREGAEPGKAGAMGDFGRIETLANLPSRTELRRQIKAAAELLQAGAPRARKPDRAPRPPLSMPDDFAAAIGKRPAAQRTYDAFAPSKQRDYVEWVLEAKREETRAKRIAQAVEWLAEGKSRNWKYESC
ncbi:MAG TPA: YdeI/OmpD-associated family protein [Roseateles sp.]|uniref:YdeI/OmpD-associated family protein n=1 Tax=Roseateles sp. TaxID=1971397 RepID=UPI002ED930E3